MPDHTSPGQAQAFMEAEPMLCYARDDSKPISERTSCQMDINHEGHHDHGGHRWSMRVNGSRRCYHCGVSDYDSQWGAGIFNDWAARHQQALRGVT